MKRSIKNIMILCVISICLCFTSVTTHAATVYISGYLRYIVEENSVTIVGYNGSESEVTIPAQIAGNPVNTIAKGAFADCATVKKINLPDTIMEIEEGALAPEQRVVYNSNLETSDKTEQEHPAEEDSETSKPDDAQAGVTKEESLQKDEGDVDEENVDIDSIDLENEDEVETQQNAVQDHEKHKEEKEGTGIVRPVVVVVIIGLVAISGYFIYKKKVL